MSAVRDLAVRLAVVGVCGVVVGLLVMVCLEPSGWSDLTRGWAAGVAAMWATERADGFFHGADK